MSQAGLPYPGGASDNSNPGATQVGIPPEQMKACKFLASPHELQGETVILVEPDSLLPDQLLQTLFQGIQPARGLGAVAQNLVGIGQGFPGSAEAEEVQKELDPGQMRGLGGRRNRNGLVECSESPVRFPFPRQMTSVLEKCFGKSVFEIASQIFGPLIPVPDAGDYELIQDRASPEGTGILDSAPGEIIRELMEVQLQGALS